METGSNSLPRAGSSNWAWIPVLACTLLCWPLICCCCLVLGAASLFVAPLRSEVTLPSGLEDIPPVQTVPAIPSISTQTPVPGSFPLLDPEAIPLFGSASLEPGFSPDPYVVEVEAGGSVDTSELEPPCGFTSYHPAFVFELAGSSDTFLRVFFTPDNGADTTLLVHTPDGEWLCEAGSLSGADPILDIPFASPGEYDVWVGTQTGKAHVTGRLSITGSMDVTP